MILNSINPHTKRTQPMSFNPDLIVRAFASPDVEYDRCTCLVLMDGTSEYVLEDLSIIDNFIDKRD